jgi:tetratricopeptide (TPR) repeat protein
MDAVDVATIAGTAIAGIGLAYAALTYYKRHEQPGPRPFRPASWRLRRPKHPPIANPRPQPTARFTGRAELLSELERVLGRGRLVVVHGLGGVGKTQLVLRYLAAHERDYEVAWWVRADQPTTLAGDLARLAAALHLPEQANPDQEVVIDAVQTWLARHQDWLLIFDNADDEPTLTRFLPTLRNERGAGRVLVTTRYDLWRDAATVPVRPWSQPEAVAFLRHSLPQTALTVATPGDGRDVDARLAALAAELGELPLALEQAAAYLHQTKTSLAGYLEAARTRGLELFAVPGEQRTVATVWSLSLERLAVTPGAAELLAVCAYLAPDSIPRALLTVPAKDAAELLAALPEPLRKVVGDPVLVARALGALGAYSLVALDEQTLSVHRLVQAVVRDQHRTQPGHEPAVPAAGWAAAAVELVAAVFPEDGGEVRNWPVCESLLPHALTAAGHAETHAAAPERTGWLLDRAATYLRARARLREAHAGFQRALAITEAARGPDHAVVGSHRNNLGLVLRDLGDLTGAEAQFERAIAIHEATYGTDHPEVAADRNNLGMVLRDLGDPAAAKVQLERALAIHEATYGADHPGVATDRNNLGMVLRDLGDLAAGKVQFERAIAIDEATYGADHPEVATDRNNLGLVLRDLGDPAAAKVQFERALAITEAALGSHHPTVGVIRKNLDTVSAREAD